MEAYYCQGKTNILNTTRYNVIITGISYNVIISSTCMLLACMLVHSHEASTMANLRMLIKFDFMLGLRHGEVFKGE